MVKILYFALSMLILGFSAGLSADQIQLERARVKDVKDGATIIIEYSGTDRKLKYIGIKVPELGNKNQPGESLGYLAFLLNRDLITSTKNEVFLEFDKIRTDEENNLLAYVYIPDQSKMINKEILRAGLAKVSWNPFNNKYYEIFRNEQQSARRIKAGIWSELKTNSEDNPPIIELVKKLFDVFKDLIPIWVALVAGICATCINHLYWEKRSRIEQKQLIFDEKTKSYLNFSSCHSGFSAYTDLLKRNESALDKIKPTTDPEEYKRLKSCSERYQEKQVEELKGMRREIGYARSFYSTSKVKDNIKQLVDLYEDIRTDRIAWDDMAYTKLFEFGKNVAEAMGEEIQIDWQKR